MMTNDKSNDDISVVCAKVDTDIKKQLDEITIMLNLPNRSETIRKAINEFITKFESERVYRG